MSDPSHWAFCLFFNGYGRAAESHLFLFLFFFFRNVCALCSLRATSRGVPELTWTGSWTNAIVGECTPRKLANGTHRGFFPLKESPFCSPLTCALIRVVCLQR